MALRFDAVMGGKLATTFKTTFDAGVLTIYSGTQPASGDTAPSGTVLGVINLPATSWTVSSNVANKTGTWEDVSANATGTAGWARLTGVDGANVDFNITATGGGGEITLDNISIVAGGKITVSSGSVTFPLA